MKYLELTIGAVLVYNFVLSRFLGICPFLGVSKRLGTAMGMSGAVIFVMTLASFITSVVFRHLLHFSFGGSVIDLGFLQVLLFILIIAALVQLIEIMLQKLSPVLYQALGIYLPLITTNCAVLGAATINANNNYTVLGTSFNLQSYARENFAVVTLHTGCLQAQARKDVIILDPLDTAIVFWIAASALSFILALFVSKKSHA